VVGRAPREREKAVVQARLLKLDRGYSDPACIKAPPRFRGSGQIVDGYSREHSGSAGRKSDQGGQDPDQRVFPAPLGPRKPRTVSASTRTSSPSSASTAP